MSKNEESLSPADGGVFIMERTVERSVVPKRGTFTLIVPDTLCFEVTESGRTIQLDFRPKTIRERVAMWRRRYGL